MPFSSKNALKQEFREITGAPLNEATKWLEQSKWKLDKAVDSYLKTKTEDQEDPRVIKIFDKYKEIGGNKDSSSEIIDIDGTLQYLEDLDCDPEDPITLVLSFFLKSPSMGVFSKTDFVRNWTQAKSYTIPQMKSHLQKLYDEFKTNHQFFKNVYSFTFAFLMENPGQKILPIETAIDYWKLLLLPRKEFESCKDRLQQWFEFVENEHSRGFSKDTWLMFLSFIEEVMIPDPEKLSGYEEMAAWPSVIDEYVEWLKEQELLK